MQQNFKNRVEELVRGIPKGRVMTYGQLAALSGSARSSRIVGGIAHFGDPELPWQRVVNKKGGLASGYPGGREAHKQHLVAEGVRVLGENDSFYVEVEKLLWRPNENKYEESQDVLVIVGPTASGKSATAHALALKHGGAIICADSRTIYRGMSIGTAKPYKKDQEEIDYYCLDTVNPGQKYTVADFKRDAEKALKTIEKQKKLPIIVGGSGLYIEALLFDYSFRDESHNHEEFQSYSTIELCQLAGRYKELSQDDKGSRRRLVRIIQTKGATPAKKDINPRYKVIGLNPPKELLKARVEKRIHKMFEEGVIDEAKSLSTMYGWKNEAMTGNIYQVLQSLVLGEVTKEEAVMLSVRADMRLVKKQSTWFRRYDFVTWCKSEQEAMTRAESLLQ